MDRKCFTAMTNDWTLFLSISCKDFNHALRLEKKIKSMKSSKYIRNVKLYPELMKKIVLESAG